MDNYSEKLKDVSVIQKLMAYIKLLRPKQWIKNLFVVAPLIFAKHIFEYNYVIRVLAAFVLFCCISSSVYVLNDIIDCEKDRLHPKKRNRPIASGIISKIEGSIVIAIYESSNNQGIYSPREPRKNYYYRCVEENFEVLERV